MRDMSVMHHRLQVLSLKLVEKCAEYGIKIGIGECYRTVAEQDALYAKGRTAPGIIVTKCKGSTYSSMHQWWIAFDFYLIMDVDGDGQTKDDTYNNKTKLYDKVGKIGKSLGLMWGGSWVTTVDRPHFQLKTWGSTPAKLKRLYGTPENFRAHWDKPLTK